MATRITSPDGIPLNEPSVFVALVDPSGGGGGMKSGRQKQWSFSAVLVAWRCNGGPVVYDPVIVTDTKIADKTLSNRMKQFSKLSIVKFTAKRAQRGTWMYPPIELTRFLGIANDKSLASVKKELQRPVEINDRLFGTITFDRDVEWFETDKFVTTEGVRITFNATTPDEAKQLISKAKSSWRARRKWFKEFQTTAYHQMFKTSASWYLDAHGEELTEGKFMELLGMPCSVSFYAADSELGFTLGGWSDELFGDHGIDINGTLRGGLES